MPTQTHTYSKEELQKKVDLIGPWHYCHVFPYGITTGSCRVEEAVHPKLAQLLKAGAFTKPAYARILDLGANSGIISMWFVDNKSSYVDAVEHGPKYYKQLELAVEVKNYSEKITPMDKDIYECDFEKWAYDLILFLGTMHHLTAETRQGVLWACKQALVPGGEIIVQTVSTLPVAELLGNAGFLDVRQLSTNWHDRAAHAARTDSMTLHEGAYACT